MPVPSLRRKSRPAHIARPSPNTPYPAGEASPVAIDEPQLMQTPHMHLESQSSWYSQPSVSPYPEESSVYSSHYDSLLPQQRYDFVAAPSTPLTPAALRLLGDAAKQAVMQWADGEIESPQGTRMNPYMANEQRTVVSECLRERIWTSPTTQVSNYAPMPTAAPPPVPRLSHRRFSLSSDGLPRKGSRKVSTRSRRSTITPPFPVGEHEEAQLIQQSMIPIAKPPTPSLSFSFSSPWPRRKASGSWASETLATPTPASTHTTSSTPFATPYDRTHRGLTPIPITSVSDYEKQVARQSTRQSHEQSHPNPSLTRGLTQKCMLGRTFAQKTPCRPKPAIAYRPDIIAPYQPGTQFQQFLHPNLQGGKHLCTRTTNTVYSDQASWLFIGTRRGPNPDEVREIDRIMTKAQAKAIAKGEDKPIEKGLKEIRKICQEKSRVWYEWVEVYIRRKWGMELFAS